MWLEYRKNERLSVFFTSSLSALKSVHSVLGLVPRLGRREVNLTIHFDSVEIKTREALTQCPIHLGLNTVVFHYERE